MRLAYKVWIEHNGKVFGEGPYTLLKGVEETGSLNKAASRIGMSYNQAWRLIKAIEGRLGYPLIHRRVGGAAGGGSEVTPQGRLLMERYSFFREGLKEQLEQLFQKHFGQE
ncbi:MAG: winged helix-turn-helix domain-containing protein [Bacillota bacterium]